MKVSSEIDCVQYPFLIKAGTRKHTRTNPAQFAPKLGSTPLEVEANSLKILARPARLERATCGFEVRRSIQLSYGRAVAMKPSYAL